MNEENNKKNTKALEENQVDKVSGGLHIHRTADSTTQDKSDGSDDSGKDLPHKPILK